MNNLFLRGPIQTGKSTLIRQVLREVYGAGFCGVSGFTSQRIIVPGSGRSSKPQTIGFRIAPANAPLTQAASFPVSEMCNVFKCFTAESRWTDLSVFETAGVEYLKQAFEDAASGRSTLVLLDEIGGHEMACEHFREKLYELLDSDIPCAGVIKMHDNARRMDPSIADLNSELHKKITGDSGEILYYERGDASVQRRLRDFIIKSKKFRTAL